MGRLLRRWGTDSASIVEEGGAHLARHRLRAGVNACIGLKSSIEVEAFG